MSQDKNNNPSQTPNSRPPQGGPAQSSAPDAPAGPGNKPTAPGEQQGPQRAADRFKGQQGSKPKEGARDKSAGGAREGDRGALAGKDQGAGKPLTPKGAQTKAQGQKTPGEAPVPGAKTGKDRVDPADRAAQRLKQSDSRAGKLAGDVADAASNKSAADRWKEADSAGKKAKVLAGEAGAKAGAALGSMLGIGPKAGAKAGRAYVYAVVGFVGLIIMPFLLFIVVLIGATAGGGSTAGGNQTMLDKTNNQVLDQIIEAGQAYDVPWPVIAGIAAAATEYGKFSPYDTYDRDPAIAGVRRASSPLPAGTPGATTTTATGGTTTVAPATTVTTNVPTTTPGTTTAGGPTPTTVTPAVTPTTGPGTMTGRRVLVVGDSLCDAEMARKPLADALANAGWQATIDCSTGRPLADIQAGTGGVQVLTARQSESYDMYVIALGTNDAQSDNSMAFASNIDRALALTGTKPVLWVNIATKQEFAPKYNQAITAAAGRHPTLTVGDFNATLNPAWSAQDGIHLNGDGYQARGTFITAQLNALAGGVPPAGITYPPNPADLHVAVYPTITPAIGGEPGQGVGMYLISPTAIAQSGLAAPQDTTFSGYGTIRTSTDYVAAELSFIRDQMIEEGFRLTGTEADDGFWTEAVRRLPLVDPRKTACTNSPVPAAGTADEQRSAIGAAIRRIWGCEFSQIPQMYTVTEAGTEPTAGPTVTSGIIFEALNVAWLYSEWGSAACDPAAELAGVFPLTATVFDTYKPTDPSAADRCDPTANITAAARAFAAGETIKPGERSGEAKAIGDRSPASGPYTPMIGGWWAMPWALGDAATLDRFLQAGPGSAWAPSAACVADADAFVLRIAGATPAAANSTTTTTPTTTTAPANTTGSTPAVASTFSSTNCNGSPTDLEQLVMRRAGILSAQLRATFPDTFAGPTTTTTPTPTTTTPTTTQVTAPATGQTSPDPALEGAEDGGAGTISPDRKPFTLPVTLRAADALVWDTNLAVIRPAGDLLTPFRPGVDSAVRRLSAGGGIPMPPVPSGMASESEYASIVVKLAVDIGGTFDGDKRYRGVDPLAKLAAFRAAGYGIGAVGADIPYADIFNSVGAQKGIDPRLLAAIAWGESNFNADANCPDIGTGYGMMQAEGRPEVCGDVTMQVTLAADMLVELYDAAGKDWTGAIWGYNNGIGFALAWTDFPGDYEKAYAFAENHYCSSASRRDRDAPDGSGRSWCVWRAEVAMRYISTDPNVRSIVGKWNEYQQTYPSGTISSISSSFAGFTGTTAGGTWVNTFNRGPVCVIGIPAGITVACQIAPQVQALIDLANQQGFFLEGGGLRPYDEQVRLFLARYTTSPVSDDSKVWNGVTYYLTPGMAEVATPGKSMHELGEAIDFDCNGALIVSQASPCFAFMAQNAGAFGLQNYPVEPWHWSTNGH